MIVVAVLYAVKARRHVSATGHNIRGEKGETNIPAVPDIDKRLLLGQFEPSLTGGFIRVETPHADREGMYLLSDAFEAFKKMRRAARADGVSLVIVSATRNYEAQKRIWQGKWTGQRLVDGMNLAQAVPDPVQRARLILRYSSMPGTSRHHWGTDIDINSVNTAYFRSGKGVREYAWLAKHAGEYGFVQPYTAKGEARPHGYEEEPWHWSYHPIARAYMRQYVEKIRIDDITGFKGAETASILNVIEHYVLGINRACFSWSAVGP